MNIYVPNRVKEKFTDWEFRGKPFQRYGKMWLRAKSKTVYLTWYYSFDEDEIFDRVYEDKVWKQ